MTEMLALGIMLVSIAGAMSGTFSVPMKFTRRWEWENIWGLGSLFGLFVALAVAFLALPDLLDIYRVSATGTLVATLLFGVGWGAGSLLFGLGVSYIGVGLGITLILGLTACVGSMIPLLIRHPDRILQPGGLALMMGLALMISGLSLLGFAGHKRDSDLGKTSGMAGKPFLVGLVICIGSGLLSPLANFAVVFGAPLTQEAVGRHGVGFAASTAPWALAFAGCYGLNVIYCGYLLTVRNSARKFSLPGTGMYWLGAFLMGALWVGAMVVYSWGALKIGDWGPYFGFPLFMINSIVCANLWGAVLGEWRGTSAATKRVLFLGLALLLVAFAVFGFANKLIVHG